MNTRYREVRARELEEEAKKLRELDILETKRMSEINVGVIIVDLEASKLAKVTGLKNGCIDFGAEYLDGTYKRGYHYLSSNWRLATAEEVLLEEIK
jgi:hypothetical protein